MSIVETQCGRVKGVARNGHVAFYGIPFAAKPQRFHPPEPAPAWSGLRNADKIGFAAPQTISPIAGVSASGPQDEDCLNLNVFTPAADGAKRPVMVWIHGGAYTHGAGYEELYNGGPLVRRGDVVVVSINYRLGALGFMYLGEHIAGASANCGSLDQIAALRWVNANIAAFGGDPSNVTIFGESAGGGSVHALTAMPGAKGLFKRAIVQSGIAHTATLSDGAAAADRVLKKLGVARGDASKLLTMPIAEIVNAQIAANGAGGLALTPLIDPATMPNQSVTAIADGYARETDMMIGSNRDESKFFAPLGRPAMEESALIAAMRNQTQCSEADAHRLAGVYRASRQARKLPAEPLDLADALQTDLMFHKFAIDCSAAQSAHRATYAYLFCHASPARRGALGSCHALEIPFVFGTYGIDSQRRFAGEGPDVERLSSAMMDAWLAFARTGNPNHDGLPAWPAYDVKRRSTMILDAACEAESDPFSEERVALAEVVG